MYQAFNNKVVIVTGGASGIGRETCIQLAHYGAHLVIGNRTITAGKALVEEIEASGGTAAFFPAM